MIYSKRRAKENWFEEGLKKARYSPIYWWTRILIEAEEILYRIDEGFKVAARGYFDDE